MHRKILFLNSKWNLRWHVWTWTHSTNTTQVKGKQTKLFPRFRLTQVLQTFVSAMTKVDATHVRPKAAPTSLLPALSRLTNLLLVSHPVGRMTFLFQPVTLAAMPLQNPSVTSTPADRTPHRAGCVTFSRAPPYCFPSHRCVCSAGRPALWGCLIISLNGFGRSQLIAPEWAE